VFFSCFLVVLMTDEDDSSYAQAKAKPAKAAQSTKPKSK
jgi:hypothetical protein